MRIFKSLLIASVSLSCLAGCEQVEQNGFKFNTQSTIEPSAERELPTELPSKIQNKLKRNAKSTSKQFTRAFERIAINDEISKSQVQDKLNELVGQQRVIILSQLLSIDKNGDGEITAKEMLSIASSQANLWRRGSTKYIPYEDADSNSDNIISLQESFIFAQKQALSSTFLDSSYDTHLMVFDSNKDGTLTRSELDVELKKITNLSPEHTKASKYTPAKLRSNSTTNSKPTSTAPDACKPTPAREKDEVVFVSGYEGSGLSSVAVTSMDEESEVARLIIEEGSTPLYIMASTYTPMIWSIEGDTKRVAKFVAGRHRKDVGAGVGVVGLPKSKVEFLPPNCLNYFYGQKQSKTILAKSKWGALVGRKPNHVASSYTINSMKIPSGENKSKKKQNITIISGDNEIQIGKNGVVIPQAVPLDKKKNFSLYRFNPEGLIKIDPKTVIAPKPVQTYDVLPQEAGIVQLVDSGHLIPLERRSFKIVKPFARFPAGLNGAHSLKFILGENVPMPGGSSGHSSVYSEATGDCLSRSCR